MINVLMLPRMVERHGLSDAEVLDYAAALLVHADMFTETPTVKGSAARDETDTKFLSLAEASGANYLVTNDRRHLLRLKKWARTAIVTPRRFLEKLK